MKKNVKKGFLFVLCMMLVSAVSIAGTLAVLTKQSNSVENTFVATQTLTDGLTLTETDAEGTPGSTLSKTFTGIVPKQTVTKDPSFTVNKVYAQSFLFVEILEGSNKLKSSETKFYTYAIADGWTELKNGEEAVAGKKGGKVWYRTLEISDETDATYDVILDDKVTIADYVENDAPANATMSIYGYMVQTSGNTAVQAFTNNFNA